MIAARMIGGPAYPEMIEEIDKELTKVIEDFDRAMSFEALRLANETSKLSFFNWSIVDPQGFVGERVEQELLIGRLKPVETNYLLNLRCMDSTRQSLLNQITDWVSSKSGQENILQRNAYWFYGSPGIGKT